MKTLRIIAFVTAAVFFLLQSCGENKGTDLVESGTYEGVVEKVVSEQREIYVRTADNKLLELYFTDETVLTGSDDIPIEFDALSKGGKVEVQVENTGDQLEPIAVKIL
ncbi:hypothetical protein [Parapedobacter tibetensis]|uniref:hypothetical protein n=1 Tax=Parapedobacter tibetensis TaxID=2972951 RepID=UPI00214DA012|nr:hypothetical protein [Parapedobacter tibetensis]